MSNAPFDTFDLSALNTTSLWEIVNDSDGKDYIMGIWTGSGKDTEICNLNLPCGHAYTLVRGAQGTKADGTLVTLYLVRNPWGIET